jgi:ABC-type dipeptide/oligopeptide/nickel transport system ATPase component
LVGGGERQPLLEVRDLRVSFGNRRALTTVVHGVGFQLAAGETLALVGESGSGKSVTCLALTGLLPQPPACRVEGSVRLLGRELVGADPVLLRAVRGKDVAYIFQEPSASLNPVFTVGEQIAEAVRQHFPEETDVEGRVVEALRMVGIRDPERRHRDYPHQLSGGMNQRVMIAMALACRPRILVADEPTTALDVTIQAEIMRLLRALKATTDMAIVLITHNFGIVKGFADRVVVMYQGRVVEQGDVETVLQTPKHAYTRELIACIPRLGAKRRRLPTIDREALREAAEASP